MIEPVLHSGGPDCRAVLSWDLPSGTAGLSSAPVGGGAVQPRWLLNIGVELDYARTDLEVHVGEVSTSLALHGPGIAMLTAADVALVRRGTCDGALVHATVGITKPTFAADPGGGWSDWAAGTINTVVQIPVPLSPAAAVNAVMTATEAKTQALQEAGVPGTGTASDAVAILWPRDGAQPISFAGPRSAWGSRIAVATHAAVSAGIPEAL